MYDIRIWEEIRSRVEWKKRSLLGEINKEIASDRSLQEWQGADPVAWQLQEAIHQRAESWIQRLYDCSSSAYRALGKEPSREFDMAVWAFCIEPFMMREVPGSDYPASELLEFLLCAVGSPPERRRLLSVSQKNCCLSVRVRLWELWRAKLLRVPSGCDEAVAALSRSHAIERQAQRIVADLYTKPPKVPHAAATPVTRPESETEPPTTEPHSTQQPKDSTNSQLAGAEAPVPTVPEARLEVVGEEDSTKPLPTVVEAKWDEIEISFISDERVQILHGKKSKTLNYAEFGFADARSGNPNQAWAILRKLAELNGAIESEIEADLEWSKVEKRIQEIRSVLRQHFGITSDPIPFLEKNRIQDKSGYQAGFKISCARSYRS